MLVITELSLGVMRGVFMACVSSSIPLCCLALFVWMAAVGSAQMDDQTAVTFMKWWSGVGRLEF